LKSQTLLKFEFARRKLLIALALVFGIALGLGIGFGLWYEGDTVERALVVRVIDGDTVELQDGRYVRYLGVDTPELGEHYGSEATARNRELVEGKMVELRSGKTDQDAYGRLLRYVFVDGIFVNAELVAQGYATAYIFDPDDPYSQVLVRLEQFAKTRERGLWGSG
jgi:micrococcal nuclease